MSGSAPATAIAVEARDASVLIVVSGWQEAVPFTLPPPPKGSWRALLDTANVSVGQDGDATLNGDCTATYLATGRSLVVLVSR